MIEIVRATLVAPLFATFVTDPEVPFMARAADRIVSTTTSPTSFFMLREAMLSPSKVDRGEIGDELIGQRIDVGSVLFQLAFRLLQSL